MDTSEPKLKIPIGIESFAEICDGDYAYVDKTLFIKSVLDAGGKATLFTRPRRFGKSLNMDMLRTFFERTQEDTSRYFRDKKIWSCGSKYTAQQGAYPVISVSFKDVKSSSWEAAYEAIKQVLRREFERQVWLNGSVFSDWNLERMNAFIKGDPGRTRVEDSLLDLSIMLHRDCGTAPIILIDEYDAPIEAAWEHRYYDEMIAFMRTLLGRALKGNLDLSFACMSGVLRVAKEGLFSGLNSLRVDGVLEDRFDECFGFTYEEVEGLAKVYGAADKMSEIKKWYEGYRFGDKKVFNPWSVLMYFDNGCKAAPYWSNTSSRGALAHVLQRTNAEFLRGLTRLLSGEKVWSKIDDSLVYPALDTRDSAQSAYTLLLMSGYLTATGKTEPAGKETKRELAIPNEEVELVYKNEILDMMRKVYDVNLTAELLDALEKGDSTHLQSTLTDLLERTVSHFDLGAEKEYQMWTLGLLAPLISIYRITSNRESGDGRFDISLAPRDDNSLPGILLELKAPGSDEKTWSDDKLHKMAIEAVEQIREKNYAVELRDLGVTDILEYGISFSGKKAHVLTGKQLDDETAQKK